MVILRFCVEGEQKKKSVKVDSKLLFVWCQNIHENGEIFGWNFQLNPLASAEKGILYFLTIISILLYRK